MIVFVLFVTFLCFLANLVAAVSGFGVSTIMLPIALSWLPFAQAILFVAILHWFHDVGKIIFFKEGIDWRLFFYLGIPSIVAGMLSAMVVTSQPPALLSAGLGVVIVIFCLLIIANKRLMFVNTPVNNILAGIVTGCIAGIFGVYGAIRSVFFVAFDVNQITFMSTTALISILLDSARSFMYFVQGTRLPSQLVWGMLIFIPASWLGVYGGRYVLERISQERFRIIVAIFLLMAGIKLIVDWLLS